MRSFLALTSLVLMTAGPTAAQTQDKNIIYKQVTEIEMKGAGVLAQAETPSGAFVSSPQRPTFNPMIKLRSDFDAEVDWSIDDIR
jgi:hypothetical protein